MIICDRAHGAKLIRDALLARAVGNEVEFNLLKVVLHAGIEF